MNILRHPSPLGTLTLASDGAALTGVYFEGQAAPAQAVKLGSDAVLDRARRALDAYFAGKLRAFHLALAPRGTPFQQAVWRALLEIPYGETRSYGDIAAALGAPAAVRAVGAANGRNPVSIIIPCHRVIGADGRLTGYAGGLERKRRLLSLEGAAAARGALQRLA